MKELTSEEKLDAINISIEALCQFRFQVGSFILGIESSDHNLRSNLVLPSPLSNSDLLRSTLSTHVYIQQLSLDLIEQIFRPTSFPSWPQWLRALLDQPAMLLGKPQAELLQRVPHRIGPCRRVRGEILSSTYACVQHCSRAEPLIKS